MEIIKTNRKLLLFFGITLFTQAVTALIAGSIFMSPFNSHEMNDGTFRVISDSLNTGYISILLHVITAAVIIMLGVAMFQVAGYINKTMAYIALSMYIFEAVVLVVGQVFTFGLLEATQIYVINGDANLFAIGNIMLACREFSGKIAMIPFGIGAVMFYYLVMKAGIFPKWLGLYGLITVNFILFGVTLMAFGVDVPFVLLIPYVPFEFFAGIYVVIKYKK